MRITVTGGTGFIGRHVAAAAAARGHAVRVLGRRSEPAGAAEYVRIDLRSAEGIARAVEGSDVVIHCAAAMGGDASEQSAITVDGTRHLLDAMTATGVRRMVGISSFAVYDLLALEDGAVLDESAPVESRPERRAPYIGAKLEQERLIREREPVDWTIVRPGLVFGPDRTWFYHLGMHLPGGMWLCLAPESPLPLTHVSNCAEAIMLAAESEAAIGATLNVVDDELPTRREYMNALRASSGARVVAAPWSLLATAASACAGLNRVMLRGRVRLPGLLEPADLHARCKPLRYANERLHGLGWSPAVSWRNGLAAAVAQ